MCLQLFAVHRESGNSSWEIPRASKAEEGVYECTAVSRAGVGRAKAQLVVTGLSLLLPLPTPFLIFPSGMSSPGVSFRGGAHQLPAAGDCPSSRVWLPMPPPACWPPFGCLTREWPVGLGWRKVEDPGLGHYPTPAQLHPTPDFSIWPLGFGQPPGPLRSHVRLSVPVP